MKDVRVEWLTGHKLEFQEDDFQRKFDIYIQEPDNIDENTGLILVIDGFGGMASSQQMSDLRNFLCNKYNVIALSVNYLGVRTKAMKSMQLVLNKEILDKIESLMTDEQIDHWIKRQDKSLDAILGYFPNQDLMQHGIIFKRVLNINEDRSLVRDYIDFGYIQTMDCLYGVKFVLDNYNLNKNRLFIYGISYAGYIAQMCAKFAPATFSLIVDLSGYALAENILVFPNAIRSFTQKKTLFGTIEESFYSKDKSSKFAFTDDMAEIRKLSSKHHIKTMAKYFDGKIVMFHGDKDILVNIETKKQLHNMYQDANIDSNLLIFSAKDIDGDIIKSDGHCMNADVKKLFEKYMSDEVLKERENNKSTDFDLQHSISYSCKKKKYVISYENSDYPTISVLKK